MSKHQEEFVLIMAAFVRSTLETMGPVFIRDHLQGKPLNKAAMELFQSIIEPVRDGRSDNHPFRPEDYGRIMDVVAKFHMNMRPPHIRAALLAELAGDEGKSAGKQRKATSANRLIKRRPR